MTPHTIFIALSGKKQTGKDTAVTYAKSILEGWGYSVKVTAFAEPLKEIAINVLGVPREFVYGSDEDKQSLVPYTWNRLPYDVRLKYANETMAGGNKVPRTGFMTARELLQILGTDIFRSMFHTNVWADAPFGREYDEDVVLITDCRFPNEKTATEDNGGTVIRLTRDTGFEDNHPSETALDSEFFEIEYENNGSVEELQDFIKGVLKNLKL